MTVFWGTKRALLGPLDVWTYRDCLLSVLEEPGWAEFARRLSLGLVAETYAAREAIEPDAAAVASAAEVYRRAERLLTVEEMEAWLRSQDLPFEEWERYIVRGVLLDQIGSRIHDTNEAVDLSGTERFGDAFFAEALCGNYLPDARDRFAQKLALAAEAGPLQLADGCDAPAILARYPWLREVTEDRLARVRGVIAVANQRLTAATTDARIRALIEQRRLDWTRLTCDVFLASDRQVARELVQCLRHEGERFVERAQHLPNVVHQVREFLLDEAPGAVQVGLLGAGHSEVAGPFVEADRHAVYWIRERRAPDSSDPDIWLRARASVEQSILKTAHTLRAREDAPRA